jgi:tetratricopeptide (TPR) repeat protein
MKRLLSLLFILGLTLSACGTSQTQSVPPAQISTPSLIPTKQTPIPSTSAVTPLPTIPTFTPIFDVSKIITVAPFEKAECPKEDPFVVAKFATPNSDGSYEIYSASDILDYLNSGGTAAHLMDSGLEKTADLTGDGVNEVAYRGLFGSYAILGCRDGKYQDFLDFAGDLGVNLADVLDLNKNGIPEIILYDILHYGYVEMFIFEWDGNKFRSLIDIRIDRLPDTVIDSISSTEHHKLMDTNGNGLEEIVAVYDVNKFCGPFTFGDFCDGTPEREQTTILGWNGQNYVVQQRYYAPAQYRFQAIQDGDEASSQREYDKALGLYQEAISSDNLDWWSKERYEVQVNAAINFVTPPPLQPDLTEYPRLAAYAYYRIMLLQLVQGQEAEAASTYQTLQETFGNDPYAAPYVEMASAFWESHQSTKKMYDGCAAAIQYAVEHPEILIPLGSDYHGWQSHIYEPADVCPFR